MLRQPRSPSRIFLQVIARCQEGDRRSSEDRHQPYRQTHFAGCRSWSVTQRKKRSFPRRSNREPKDNFPPGQHNPRFFCAPLPEENPRLEIFESLRHYATRFWKR